MKKMNKAIFVSILAMICCFMVPVKSDAKATNAAMKFLKGTWVIVGQSESVKSIFTKQYMIDYSLWDKNYVNVKSPKKKGKLIGKSKIIYTKKRGKTWYIKVKTGKNRYNYYKGSKDGLICYDKATGNEYFSSSYNRYSKKVYK